MLQHVPRLPTARIAVVLCLFALSCSSEGDPLRPKLKHYYASTVLDSYAGPGLVDLFWTVLTEPPYDDIGGPPPGPPVAHVAILRSTQGPERGYVKVLARSGGGPDSVTLKGMTDGSQYWFKIAAYDNLGRHIITSKPVAVLPGPRTLAIGSMAVTPWGRMSWVPSGDSLVYMEKLGLEAAEARIVALSSLTSQPIGPSGPPSGIIYDAEVSPDGKKLAYTRTPSLTIAWIDYRVWVADRTDGTQQSVTAGRVDFNGTWGNLDLLYFCRGTYEPPNIYQIWSADLGSGEARAVTQDMELRKFHPSVRPSDQLIVFEGQDTQEYDHSLYLLNPSSGSRLPLTTETWCSDSAPSWAPDGRHVLFVSDRSGHTEIWAIDVATRSMVQVTRGTRGSAKQYVRSSPDGQVLAVVDGMSWPGHPAQLQFYSGLGLLP